MISPTLFSILTPLENVMQSILDFFHGSVGLPWAWSIVALTILTRIVLVPLTVRQIHSMQALQAHAPEMKAIQQKYKGDRAKLNEELMKFYKENNINPAASCLPLLAQFPVFIIGKVDMVGDARTKAGIAGEELVHAVGVARQNHHEIVALRLHDLQ